jgi:hypothetical protein
VELAVLCHTNVVGDLATKFAKVPTLFLAELAGFSALKKGYLIDLTKCTRNTYP